MLGANGFLSREMHVHFGDRPSVAHADHPPALHLVMLRLKTHRAIIQEVHSEVHAHHLAREVSLAWGKATISNNKTIFQCPLTALTHGQWTHPSSHCF